MNVKKIYELMPHDGRKSFYGKAKILLQNDGTETLLSYDTPIMSRQPNGVIIRHWDGWSATTGRHVKAFCGKDKRDYCEMAVHPLNF